MLALGSLKNQWHWTGLALLCALIAITAFVAPARVSQLELRREAVVAADRIRAQMLKEPDAVFDALSRPGLAPQLANVLEHSGYAHRVLRFELYDENDRLKFTSGLSGLNLTSAAPVAGPTPETPEVALYESASEGGAPTHFAVLTLPLQLNGTPGGTLVVYLNQTDQASVLSDYFGIIAAITLLLLGVGVATPVAFAWMRSQERRQAEEQVRYLESHDALTGLSNRKAFSDGLAEAIVRMNQDHTHIAVLCLNIDKFKEINDAAEPGGGDQVLREIGARIKLTLREGDLLARLSGDEFAIALVDITNLGDVMAFMNRLVDALRQPIQVADKEVLCTTSVGIALAPADGDKASMVLRHAAIALARAKGDGGQRMCFFEPSMDKALQRRRTVEHELRLALGREEFDVVYQPQYDLTTERQCGSEALIRWHHPVHGKIAPGHFISVAEDTGLIVPIGEWVLRRACCDAATWSEPLTIAVNLSPAQFRDGDIAETVAQVLKETGLDRRAARARDHREPPDQRHRGGARQAQPPARSRRGHRHGRFRHRLFELELSRPLPLLQNQDRPAVHPQHDARPGHAGDRQDHHRARQVARRDHHRRRGGDGRASGDAARVRLPASAGLPVRLSRRRRAGQQVARKRQGHVDHAREAAPPDYPWFA